MIIESQSKNGFKCELVHDEAEEIVYLNLYKKNQRLFSWEIFEGFHNKYEYNFFQVDYDVDYIIDLFTKFDLIAKRIRVFIAENNLYKDKGERYFNRESSNQVYEWLMKEYDLWR